MTVTRHNENGLVATVDSVIPLLGSDVELIVVEGDSAECETSRMLRNRLEAAGANASWCIFPDRGTYHAMNRGILASTGRWIWFVNSGDMVPKSLEIRHLLDWLDSADHSHHWAVATARIVDPSGDRIALKGFDSIAGLHGGRSMPCHQAVFVRRTAFSLVGGFCDRYRISGDYDLLLRLSALGDPHVSSLEVIDFAVGGVSTRNRGRLELEHAWARDRTLVRPPHVRLADWARAVIRQRYRLGH